MWGVEDWSGVLLLFGVVELLLLDEVLESVALPLASVDLWCFLCFLVVVWLPLASVEVVEVVVLCVVSVLGVLEDEELD